MVSSNIVFKGKTEAIYKIIVIGDPAVGKTELLAKFATNQFEEKYLPTVGVSILKETIELKVYNTRICLMFWDIAGQPQFYMLHRPYFNGADGMLLVFDLTRSSTFSNINNWYSSAVNYGLSDIPRILLGNKAHLSEERKIILPMAKHLAEKLNASYYETSPLSGENFKEAFEKIAELVYKAKSLNYNWKKDPLIFKAYEGPTQPSSVVREIKPLEADFRNYF
jgi:Ras-related protein Rab-1A